MTKWEGFTLSPLDVWLFRDGRSFTAGEDVRAFSKELPSPFTVFGALRTFFLVEGGIRPRDFFERRLPNQTQEEVEDKWGKAGPFPGKLRLRGPFWQKAGQLYFPLPADIVQVENRLTCLRPLRETQGRLSLDKEVLRPLWVKAAAPLLPRRGYISQEGLRCYLEGQLEEIEAHIKEAKDLRQLGSVRSECPQIKDSIKEAEDFFEKETRTGIKVGKGRTVEEGYFYQVEYIRPKEDVALYGEFQLPPGVAPKEEVLFLGGERRMACLSLKEPILDSIIKNKKQDNTSYLKIVLLTPAWFSGGWRPQKGWQELLPGWKLCSVAQQRLETQRSFLMKNGHPMAYFFSFVPAGTVYFFEREGGSTESLPEAFTEEPKVGDELIPLKALGFGLYVVSSWKYA